MPAITAKDEILVSQAANPPASASNAAGVTEEPNETGHRPRRRWTPDEDAKLIAAVNKFGSQRGPGSQWSKISAGLPGRTNKDCRKRWFHSLDPRVRKGRWSSDEDELLRQLYAELGPQWKEIALRIPGRKDDQVSKRWRDVLAPELTSKKPWSDEEDALLLALLEKKGPKWTAIAEQLPGRSPIACRNRSRKYRKQPSAAPASTETVHTDSSTPTSSTHSQSRSSPELPGEQDHRRDQHGAWGDVDILLAQHVANVNSTSQHPRHNTNNAPHTPHAQPRDPAEWHLPDLTAPPVQPLDLFNFEVTTPIPTGLGPAVTGSEAAEAGILEGWLASVSASGLSNGGGVNLPNVGNHHNASGTSSVSSVTATSAALPTVPSTDDLNAITALTANDKPLQVLYGHSEVPVNNMWSLLLALDRGEQSVTVNSQLLRQLVADAPAKLRQQTLSMELS